MTKTHGTPVNGTADPDDLVSCGTDTYLVLEKHTPPEDAPRTFTIVHTETGRRVLSNLAHPEWKYV